MEKHRQAENAVFLVSYPKSGNTWVRFLLGNYIADKRVDFNNYHEYVPDIHQDPSLGNTYSSAPRFIKSHFAYTPDYRKVVYLVRDGRDVAVSYYYHQKRLGNLNGQEDFLSFLENFLQQGIGRYGRWDEHVMSWVQADNVLVVRYEDLLKDVKQELAKILDYAGEVVEPERLERAVNASTFLEMQKLERKQTDTCQSLGGAVDQSIRFVRRGEKGQWQDYINEDESALMSGLFISVLAKLGYGR